MSSYSDDDFSRSGERDDHSSSSFDSEEAEEEMDDPSDPKSQKATQSSVTAQEQFSSFHVFGLHLSTDLKQQHMKSFHARLMNLVNPDLLFVPDLDNLL